MNPLIIKPQNEIKPITDLDGIMKAMSEQLPMADGEILYKVEIDSQIKIYLGMFLLGIVMIIVSILLNIRIWGTT